MSIFHLYTEPIVICHKAEIPYGTHGIETHYYPTNKEQ
jgi:hypothetical protein